MATKNGAADYILHINLPKVKLKQHNDTKEFRMSVEEEGKSSVGIINDNFERGSFLLKIRDSRD